MTLLSPEGQFSSTDNPLPTVFSHEHQQVLYPFRSTAQKLLIIIMQLGKSYDRGDRKLNETWPNLMRNRLVKVF
jgi:hypothetical protein